MSIKSTVKVYSRDVGGNIGTVFIHEAVIGDYAGQLITLNHAMKTKNDKYYHIQALLYKSHQVDKWLIATRISKSKRSKQCVKLLISMMKEHEKERKESKSRPDKAITTDKVSTKE